MPKLTDVYAPPRELVLGTRLNQRVPEGDQKRQRLEAVEILRRLRHQPGVILGDEVGMGKTFVALAIAYTVAMASRRGPVVVMVPANLIDKWVQDLGTFCELYLENREPVKRGDATKNESAVPVRYDVARHSVDFMKLLDDAPRVRCHLIFLAQGALSRQQTDKWVRLALIAEALRHHGRGGARRLIQVKGQIHRFLAELLQAIGEQRAHDWGDELWQSLLRTPPDAWKEVYNGAVRNEGHRLDDDPVPRHVTKALKRIDLSLLADALKQMPVRASGDDGRLSERLCDVRQALRQVEEELWKDVLATAPWKSPLLIMDEAHHLKNPGTSLARQLQSPDSDDDLRTGDGAMAHTFDRMLFLTATPFQLGHHELVHVLERFGDVCWDHDALGDREAFGRRLSELLQALDKSQRAAIALQRSWSRLRLEDYAGEGNAWWAMLRGRARTSLTSHQRAVVDAYETAQQSRNVTQTALQPWLVRHNKGEQWPDTKIDRRQRIEGAAVAGQEGTTGLPIPPQQLMPFFLAARSAAQPDADLLSEALCSSYEAFRFTRKSQDSGKDEPEEEPVAPTIDLSRARWYLGEFDRALESCNGSAHPKVCVTVKRVVDLWEQGEKVLIFAFYRRTCRALRVHISEEIERRLQRRVGDAGLESSRGAVERLVERIQKRYFDDLDSSARRSVDAALEGIVQAQTPSLDAQGVTAQQRDDVVAVMRRFLRVSTTLIRCFPIVDVDKIKPARAVATMLDSVDSSAVPWRTKFDRFVAFLTEQCSEVERRLCLEAALKTQTGGIRVEDDDEGDARSATLTLANVQVATGKTNRETRARLMRAFNTPFFPDILVCSEVMGEGVDLQRSCRHVIHHDLAWNPSTIEQRTGRIDRLGCKAEGRHPIVVYLPYLDGAADERQFRVMRDREQWFRVVMGQDEVARLITRDSGGALPLPAAISDELTFDLGIGTAPR